MENLSKEAIEREEQEREAFRPKLLKKQRDWEKRPYHCDICEQDFPMDKPCGHKEEMLEKVRMRNMTIFYEESTSVESEEEYETKMWSIAKRLTYVDHIKR